MGDLISRQAAIDAMCELMHHWFGGDPKDEVREINRELGKLPTAQERKKGKWVDDNDAIIHGHCSVCGWSAIWQETDVFGYNYCPNCGAEMRGDGNEMDS